MADIAAIDKGLQATRLPLQWQTEAEQIKVDNLLPEEKALIQNLL